MTQRSLSSLALIYGIPLSIIAFSLFLLTGAQLEINAEMAAAITYDLCLTVPLVYFLLIRKRNISKVSVVPFFILGIALATFFIPKDHQTHLDLIKTFLLPVVEISVLAFVIFQVRKAVKSFKAQAKGQPDFLLMARESCLKLTGKPRIAHLMAAEIGTIYYSFFAWKRRLLQADEFTAYKKSPISAIFGAFIMLILVESIAMHFIFIKWNEVFAWIIFALSIYTVFQLFAHVRALRKRPHRIGQDSLFLKYGLFGEMQIPFDQIEKVELTSRYSETEGEKAERLALIDDLEGYNVAIYLKEELAMTKAFGMTKMCDVVLVFVDEKENFVSSLRKLY
jgi:hypothetical protein